MRHAESAIAMVTHPHNVLVLLSLNLNHCMLFVIACVFMCCERVQLIFESLEVVFILYK